MCYIGPMPAAPPPPDGSGIGVESLRRILRILRVATSTLDPKVLFRGVVDAIQAEFPDLFHVSIFLAFEGPRVFVPMALAGESPDIFVEKYPGGYTQSLDVGLLGQAWKSRRTYLSNDVQSDPHYRSALDAVTQSELCVPIRVDDAVIAVMNLESRSTDAFPPWDVELFELLADQLANAVRNSMAHDELASRHDRPSILESAEVALANTVRDILDALGSPILRIDATDNVAFANKAAAEVFGTGDGELVGRSIAELLDPASLGRWSEARVEPSVNGRDLSLAFAHGGRVVTGAWQAFPVRDGRPPYPFLLKRRD